MIVLVLAACTDPAVLARLDALERRQAELEAALAAAQAPAPPSSPVQILETVEGPDGELRVVLEAASAREALRDPSALARVARVVPHRTAEGVVDGLKLFGIRAGTLPALAGFHNGDVVLAVDGHAVSSPDAALEAYEALRDHTVFTFAIERAGQPRTLVVELR
jgi:type II secretory pathway component PulC